MTRRFLDLSFADGVDSSLDSHLIPNGKAAVMRNWFPHEDGGIHPRTQWIGQSTAGTEPTGDAIGIYATGDKPGGVYVFERDTKAMYRTTTDDVPLGTWAIIDDLTGTGPPSTWIPITSGAGYVVWAPTISSAESLRKFDGTTASAAGANNAGSALAFHKNRFWLGGVPPNYHKLYYSGINDPDTWNLSTDFFDVGGDTENFSGITDLEPFLDGLLIGKRDGVWFLIGDGPSNFSLHKLDGGQATAGKTIVATPYGALFVGGRQPWLWTGGGPVIPFEQMIWNPETETGYSAQVYETAAYIRDKVYIAAKDSHNLPSDNIWVWDPRRNVWSTEDYIPGTNEEIKGIVASGSALIGATENAVGSGPSGIGSVAYRNFIVNEWGKRDISVAETFDLKTGHIQLGDFAMARPATLRHLHLLLRQRNGDSSDAALVVQATVDGVVQSSSPITPGSPGVVRKRVDFPVTATGFEHQIRISHALTTTDEATFSILRARLEYDEEEGLR